MIVRRLEYDVEKAPGFPAPQDKTGERLLVRGLQGFQKLSTEVGLKKKSANEIARPIADDSACAQR